MIAPNATVQYKNNNTNRDYILRGTSYTYIIIAWTEKRENKNINSFVILYIVRKIIISNVSYESPHLILLSQRTMSR